MTLQYKYDFFFFFTNPDFQLVTNVNLFLQILQHIALSRNGLTEPEIFALVPIEWTEWLQLFTLLQDKHIVTTRVGLVILENQQVRDANTLD